METRHEAETLALADCAGIEGAGMTFETFWADHRIPKRMKRCGPGPVRKALMRRSEAEWESILDSLEGYQRNKEGYEDYCHLSTYINQERDKVEWDDMEELHPHADKCFDQRRHESELHSYVTTGDWRGAENRQPTIEEARAELHREGWSGMEPKLNVVPLAKQEQQS